MQKRGNCICGVNPTQRYWNTGNSKLIKGVILILTCAYAELFGRGFWCIRCF